MSPGSLPDGYALSEGTPDVKSYLALRKGAGLSPRRPDQAESGLPGSWYAVFVVLEETGEPVGMGRVIGDGGWYFHILDMAVSPEHQRKGIGDTILSALIERIRKDAPGGAFVSLLADPPGRRLYTRHGFEETAPASLGMALILE
jgi:ribosomal protein S18 acetylase RimI-like enzyme